MRVGVTRTAFNVHLAGVEHAPLFGGELYGAVLPSQCSWRLRPPKRDDVAHGEIELTLRKGTAAAGALGHWKDLCKRYYS